MTAEPNSYPLEPADIAALERWAQAHPEPVTLILAQSDHNEQATFANLATALSEHIPQLTIETGKGAPLPGFQIRPHFLYSALPLGKELAPFLKILEALNAPPAEDTTGLDLPCRLDLFIALQCPHCPAMVETLAPLALASEKLNLNIIDGSLFPDQATAQNVMSAPCLILDQGFRWTGAVSAQEILSMAINRDPAALGADTLKTILEAGDADWITREMIQAKAVFPAFLDLILHPTWSVRLGAMVVVEALAEEAPELALEICPPLVTAFNDADIPLKGDILYALGEAGNAETREWIQSVLPHLDHPDLKDAAQDALESLDS